MSLLDQKLHSKQQINLGEINKMMRVCISWREQFQKKWFGLFPSTPIIPPLDCSSKIAVSS
jgi:hypothetical protein